MSHAVCKALFVCLYAGEASKLAGRLAWLNRACFKRLGRTFLYPIFAQQKAKSSAVVSGSPLETALRWWLNALDLRLSEVRTWEHQRKNLCRMFVDARSTPPRIAAVLVVDKVILYSDMEPSKEASASLSCIRVNVNFSVVFEGSSPEMMETS